MGEKGSDLTYCELRAKEIINTFDGRRLGRVVDIVFSSCGSDVKGIVVPYERRLFFSRNREIFIPWKCINKIGEDVILVSLKEGSQPGRGGGRGGHGHDHGHGHDDHDRGHGHDDYGHDGHERGKNDCGHGRHNSCGCGCDDKHCNDRHHNDKCYDNDKTRGECKGGDRVYDAPHRRESLRCDRKCEKCMLFDCAYRWRE